MKLKITTLLLGFILLAGSSFAQWQKTGGPSETSTTTFEEYFGVYYLGTANSGLFSSANLGVNWTPVTFFQDTGTSHSITRIVNHLDSLFVATYSGIYVTGGNAATWHRVTDTIPDTLYNFNLFQANNELFATAFDFDWVNYAYFTHLYHLNDLTRQWNEVPNLPKDVEITDITAVHDTIYCAIPGHGLFLTHNNGATWDSLNASFGVLNTSNVRLVRADGEKIYAVGYNNTNELLTSNDGLNWQYGSITQLGGNVATTMAVYGDTVIIGAPGAEAFSHNGGSTWSYSFFPDHDFNEIKVMNSGDIVYACDQTMGILSSLNDSLWTPGNNGLPYANTTGLAHPFSSLYAMDAVNLFSSTDHGDNWQIDTSYLWNVHDIARMGNKLLAFTTNGQSNITSIDQGQTWSADTGSGVRITTKKILVDNNNRVIYALGPNDICRSNDYGETWKALFYTDGGIPHDTLFTGMTRIKNRLFVTLTDTTYALMYSDDEGAHWQRTHTGSVVYHAEAVDTVLVISSDVGIEKSTDRGVTFTTVLPGGQLNNTYANGTTLFNYGVDTANGIRYSTDYGATWTNISPNADSTGVVNALLMDDTYLYAATAYSSVWRKPLSDIGITYTPDTSNNYNVAVQQVNRNTDGTVNIYPNPYNEQTTIAVTTAATHDIKIRVYDMTGRLIQLVAQGSYPSGIHTFTLQQNMPSGIYLLVTNIDDMSVTKKVIKQ